jgi:outer membrane protein assembly factor BamB
MRTRAALLVLFAAASLPARAAPAPDDATRALLAQVGVPRGLCVLLEDKGCARAIDLARASGLLLFVQLADPADAAAARRAADEAGLYGTRVFVDAGPLTRLPLADAVADAVVVEDADAVRDAAAVKEIYRVLRPGGHDVVGGSVGTKKPPEGIDDWSHHYHGPDNNAQSRDRLARAPYLTQFVAGPRYAPAPQAAVAAGGRLFMAFGNVAWHEREEAWLNTLVAVSAYNGALLWRRPLPPGLLVDRCTMVAAPDALYLADDVSCKVLDAATGEVRGEIVPPAGQADGPCWKWMALDGGVLYGLVGEPDPPDPDARWKMTNHGWPWDRISQGYNAKEVAWGFAKTLFAFDPATKQVLWQHKEEEPVDSRGVCLASGRLFVSRFGRYLAALDAKTGSQVWRRTVEQDKDLFEAIGPYRPGHGWIPGWKSTSYVKATDKALYLNGPQTSWLTALGAKDGALLWKHPVKDLQVVVRDEGLYVIGPERSTGQTKRLDPLTGAVLAELPTMRRACTRATGGPDAIFFRAYDGTTRLDLAAGQPRHVAPMRPSCHVGVIVAHGHLYWVPWACDCNLQMFGTIALGPAGGFPFGKDAVEGERLEAGPGPAGTVVPFPVAEVEWSAYRADAARSASTKAALPEKAALTWKADGRPGVDPTAPVAAGGLVFVGGTDGVLRALGADDGKARWTAYTGGALRFPPAIADGRAIVGSGDGWVYAFEAATGRLLWRFRAAPAERRIAVFDALLSTWPAAAPVAVAKGIVYAAAGMNAFDGTHVYALDAATGRIVWQNNASGHLESDARSGVAVQGETLLHDGRLFLAGGNAASPGVYDLADGTCRTPAPKGVATAAPRGRELEIVDGRVVVSGQPFYSHPDFPVYDKPVQWREQRVRAANGDLVVVKERNPGAGAAWRLSAREKGTDAERWSVALPGEPVRWGVAVDAKGRIVVTLRDGGVI